MEWIQRKLTLRPYSRGFHLITSDVLSALPEIAQLEVGMLNVFVQHTSASLSLNENADPDVREDLEMAMSTIVPESLPYIHTIEGSDDMPAHVKHSLLGASVWVPIAAGRLCFGTWQGFYLCEHRDRASARRLVLTVFGARREPA